MGSFLVSPDGNRVELVKLGSLQIPSYQRDLKRSSELVRDGFDVRLFEVITVSRRSDGTLWIVDGQQRVTGLRNRYEKTEGKDTAKDALILARVFEGLTVEQEVYMFVNLNKGRVRVSAYAIFHAEVEALVREAVELNQAITSVKMWTGLDEYDEFGGHVGTAERSTASAVGCIAWLRKNPMQWADDGITITRLAIEVAKRAYGSKRNVLHEAIIGGLCLTLREIFANETARKQWKGTRDLAERIGNYSSKSCSTTSPDAVLSWCRGGKNLGGGHGLPQLASAAFAQAWNHDRRTARIFIEIKFTTGE